MTIPGRLESTVLVAKEFEIDTRSEPVIFLRSDSPVARAEGFNSMSRLQVQANGRTIIATLVIVGEQLLQPGYAGLSMVARRLLDVREGQSMHLSHPAPLTSLAFVRSKIYGNQLGSIEFRQIVSDIVAGKYMDVHLAAFITACADDRLNRDEIVYLTNSMVEAGKQLHWDGAHIVDKHSVGGLPGNRTTPIIVAIVVANGLVMPKTSSRAITSPSGTADTMETLAPVDLGVAAMQEVVHKEGGCIVWGGSANLSPADDILIRVEKALDIDSEGQLVASVLSKKIAAGSTDVVIDMPVGPTAKVRSETAAQELSALFAYVGTQLGIRTQVVITDGQQPVGRRIGPALEARDVLGVLREEADAPSDLRERAVALAAVLLENAEVVPVGKGIERASQTLASGAAWRKFQSICEAQGGMREPPQALYRYTIEAQRDGIVRSINNRTLARVAKLAGAPADKAAGLEIHVKVGDQVSEKDVLMTVHAESPGELEYALEFERAQPSAVEIGPAP